MSHHDSLVVAKGATVVKKPPMSCRDLLVVEVGGVVVGKRKEHHQRVMVTCLWLQIGCCCREETTNKLL